MKQILALTCMMATPVLAQMQMQMPRPVEGTAKHSQTSHTEAGKAGTAAVSSGSSLVQPMPPAMPLGQLADGDTSTGARPVPATPTPVTLDSSVQEQEHTDQRTGSADPGMPDLLADVKTRPPLPLQHFLDLAAKNNPTLRSAEAEVRRLQGEAKQAGLWQNPEIGYEADHVRGGSYAGGEQGGYLQQIVPLGGQPGAARAAVQAQASAAEAALQAQRLRVASAAEQAFYAALTLQREAELRAQLAALASDAAVAAHQLANIGQADAPDVLGSEVEREQARMELATAQRSYHKAFVLLAAVSGDAAMPVSPLQGDLAAVPVLQDTAASAAATMSPALQTAQRTAAAGDAEIRSAHRAALPQLTLKAGLQQDNEPLGNLPGRVGVVGIAQASLTLPLWNRNQGAVAAAKAKLAVARAEVARTELSLQAEAAQTMQDYTNAMEQAQRYRDELLPRAQRAVELYQQKYAVMAAGYPQRMLSQKMLLQLRLEYTRTLGTAWQSAVLLQHGMLQDGLAAPYRTGLWKGSPGE